MNKPRFTLEGVTATWDVLLSDGQVLGGLPVVGEDLQPGKGPGNLEWHAIVDADVPGLRATWRGGAFVILRVSTRKCALFHERRPGDFTPIAVGSPDALKAQAGLRCAPPRRHPVPPAPPPAPTPPPRLMSHQEAATHIRFWRRMRS